MEAIYQVVGKGHGKKMFEKEFKHLFQDQFDGIEESQHLRKCLQGQPKLKGMCGPMYDGEWMGHPVVRYESWAAYDILSA